MKYIKSPKEYMTDINDMIFKFKIRFNDFIDNMKDVNDKTKEAFDLLLKAHRGELMDENKNPRYLNIEEIKQIKKQTVDFLKLIGLTSLTLLPGGTFVFVLLRVFKLNDHILPSSFKKLKPVKKDKE